MGIFQRLFETAFPAFAQTHKLPQHVHVAAQAVKTCRTAALGGHVRRCPAGHVTAVWYNSCGHRACPQCGLRRLGQWLDAWQQLLLPTGHFHVIFTLPSELHELWRWNRTAMATLLFRCVKETLFTLLDDPKRLGARPGVLATLHTWSRTLALHPHVHCLVTGGGVRREGQWQAISTDYLLPVAVVRKLFQGKVLGGIERLWQSGQLVLPPVLDEDGLHQLLVTAAGKQWNVRLVKQYSHGRGVVKYLARYVRGGPIKAQRVRAFDGQQVRLRTKLASADVRLAVPEFLRRWSEHVPLPGFHMVRAWGLYAAAQRQRLEQCRLQLVQESAGTVLPPLQEETGEEAPWERCPTCGRSMPITEAWPRGGAPPPALLPEAA